MSHLGFNECLSAVLNTNYEYIKRWNILWIIYQTVYFYPLLFALFSTTTFILVIYNNKCSLKIFKYVKV